MIELARLMFRQLGFKSGRTMLTIAAVALVIFCFLFLQTISWAWQIALEERRDDRIAVWNKTTYALNLPKAYAERVAAVDGVLQTSYASYFEGVDPNSRLQNQAPSMLAVQPDTYFKVYPESNLTPQQLSSWQADRQGAIVSKKMADVYGYKIGDKVTIVGKNYSGTWNFTIRGIYQSNYRTFADNLFLFHWDYLHEKLEPDDRRRGEISWLMGLVDSRRSLQIVKDVEAAFAKDKVQTQAMTERNMVGLFMGNFVGILSAFNFIGGLLLITMGLMLFNLLSMRIRERKFEFGILRAIGFRKAQVQGLIFGESLLIGLAAGALGIGLSIWLINHTIGGQLQENMGALFPFFSVPGFAMVLALVLPAGLAVLASLPDAVKASKIEIGTLMREIE